MTTDTKISWEDFEKVDLRTGTILTATLHTSANRPSYLLQIDFGDLGIKKSSAQITTLYTPDKLIGKQIVAVVNFPPKQIGKHISECLVLGIVQGADVTLLSTDQRTPNGLKIS